MSGGAAGAMGEDERRRANSTGRTDARVADVGEFGLIDRLARLLGDPDADPLRPAAVGEIAIGDDAAVWSPAADHWEVLTTDALIEDVHFKLGTTSWHDLGWKALAENVSDVAAMGARPRRAFVTLGLRGDTRVADLEALYRGMRALADRFELRVVGGDTVSAPLTLISVSVVGDLEGPGLRRAAGQPGDVLAVTGTLGGSAGGLEILEGGTLAPVDEDGRALVERHRRPRPRVQEGLALARAGVGCGMDLSDGLLGDAAKLAHASGLGATIRWEDVPVDPALARRFGQRSRQMALAGGEDYELLVAAPPDVLEQAGDALARAGLTALTPVGQLTEGPPGTVRVVDPAGHEIRAVSRSWDHFSSTAGAS